MIEKLKNIAAASKGFLIWVIGPITLIMFYIFNLKTKNNKLEDELAQAVANAKLKETEDKLKESKNEADKDSDDYSALKRKYDASGGSDVPGGT